MKDKQLTSSSYRCTVMQTLTYKHTAADQNNGPIWNRSKTGIESYLQPVSKCPIISVSNCTDNISVGYCSRRVHSLK